MKEPKKHVPYVHESKCSVPNCSELAEFEVYLWDYYEYLSSSKEFFEQDFTCPFLCRSHMEENERLAQGRRVPRGYVSYPYTNQHSAQGYTIYRPLEEAYPLLYTIRRPALSGQLIQSVIDINDELIAYLATRPDLLREVHPRNFERLVAAIFNNQGFYVELTPATRDGGFDIIAARKDQIGNHLYLIECKRYSMSKKVGVEIVRGLYGNKMAKRATKGVIATTSYFTKDAVDFASPLQYELSLKDFDSVTKWIKDWAAQTGSQE